MLYLWVTIIPKPRQLYEYLSQVNFKSRICVGDLNYGQLNISDSWNDILNRKVEVKVKLSLCLTNYHTMKTYRKVEV
jgi:hypothetical protein